MNRYLALIISLITLLTGFTSFVLMSILYDVFTNKENVMIPLVYNSSVMIGDLLLLPIINYKFFSYYSHMKKIKRSKISVIALIIIGIIISFIINFTSHLSWVNDSVTDFVSFTPGSISIIGIWHMIFSIAQTFIFLSFVYFWYKSIQNQQYFLTKELKKIWKWIFLFTLLSVNDMLIKNFFIFKEISIFEVIQLDKFFFVTPLGFLFLLVGFTVFENKKNKQILSDQNLNTQNI